MTLIYILYILAMIAHFEALRCGVRTICRFSDRFVNSHWTQFFKSKTERQYWIITLSSIANVLFLLSMAQYLSAGLGALKPHLELMFVVFHVSEAAAVMLWHHLTYANLRDETCINV